jgi:hypothetical protein
LDSKAPGSSNEGEEVDLAADIVDEEVPF